jgi:iron complex outermembrane receptor protein
MIGFSHRLMASVALAMATPAVGLFYPAVAMAQAPAEMINFDIPSQPLGDALNAFSKQAGVQIMFPYDAVTGRTSPKLTARLSRQEALGRLIAGSGLELISDDGRTVTLHAVRTPPAGDEAATYAVNEVVVTASARRNEQAIAVHRDALGVADAVTQDDTGDLADQTVAAALIRLPGISTMQTLYGEQSAEYVSVRGISPDLNSATFDGIGLYSASNDGAGTRRVDLQLIPTQVSRTTEVFKTFTSDLDAGVIGGATNMVPYSALDGKDQFYVDVGAEYRPNKRRVPGFNSPGDYIDTPWGGSLKGLYVHRFGSEDQFGVVASAVYNQESWTASKPNVNGRTYYTTAGTTAATNLSNWNGFSPLPTLARPMDYTKFRKLYGGYLGFEYRVDDSLKLSASVYDYKQREDQTLSDFYAETFSGVNYTSPTTATFKIGRVRPAFDYDLFKTESRELILKGEKDFGGGNSLTVRGAYGLSSFRDTDNGVAYSYAPTNDFVSFDMTNATPTFTFSNPQDMVDTSKFTNFSASDIYSRTMFNSYEARADFKHNYGSGEQGFGFAAGVDARNVNAKRDLNQVDYTPAGPLGSLGTVVNFGSYGFGGYPSIFIDGDGFNTKVKPGLAINAKSSQNDSLSSDYQYDETILAAYVSGMYAFDNTRVIGGLRVENVRYTAYVPQSLAGTYLGTFAQNKGKYQHVLPSLSVIHDVNENLKLKAAFSQTLGRPAFSDIAQAEVRSDTALTISRGNPDLKPRESKNYDVAAEYYFNGRDGMVSIAGFYKDIKNDIYSLLTSQDVNGVRYDVTTPQNASNSSLKGIEAQFIDNKIGLPGPFRDKLGVSLNVTRMWGQMNYLVAGVPQRRNGLLYQPNWLANGQIFYKLPHDGEFRIAYNWADKSLNTVNAQLWNDYVLQPRGQLNASIRYALRPNIILKLEGDNLLGANKSMMHGYFSNRYTLTIDRSFFLNIVFKG